MTRYATTALAALALALSGCDRAVDGQPVAASATAKHMQTDASNVPAPPSTPDTPVVHNIGEEVQFFIEDLNRFWGMYEITTGAMAKEETAPFTCPHGEPTKGNAANCAGVVLYDAEGLEAEASGHRYVVGEVIAHEVGHTVEAQLGQHDRSVYAHELAADCLSGMYVAGKGVPLADASQDFTHTGMYAYAGDEALTAFQKGYNNFSDSDMSIAHVKRCIPKEH
ncbi:hypothetical protein [Mycobacterium sp. Lab-001]|uniref:hypothetical protein n=1 Tax=Mycobacterium sp. Lab-001 TaxID=3410136 RepID=UPI003D177894